MPLSQFSVFSSGDANGPGLLANSSGDLIRIMTACLVTGYSGVTAVNWTNPIATASNMAVYRPPSGSRMHLVVGDDGASALVTKAAYWAGWETVAGIATPVGSGTGQFPTAAQYTPGAVLAHKHNGVGVAGRPWTIFADAYGCYLFVDTGADGTYISGQYFGDIYSYNVNADPYRCIVAGNLIGGVNGSYSAFDRMIGPDGSGTNPWAVTSVASNLRNYMCRGGGGGGSSAHAAFAGDVFSTYNSAGYCRMTGSASLGGNNGQFLAPIRIVETSTGYVRGRMRGLYHSVHAAANYPHGLTFSGGGDYAGKTFMAMGPGGSGGVWIVETSATIANN